MVTITQLDKHTWVGRQGDTEIARAGTWLEVLRLVIAAGATAIHWGGAGALTTTS